MHNLKFSKAPSQRDMWDAVLDHYAQEAHLTILLTLDVLLPKDPFPKNGSPLSRSQERSLRQRQRHLDWVGRLCMQRGAYICEKTYAQVKKHAAEDEDTLLQALKSRVVTTIMEEGDQLPYHKELDDFDHVDCSLDDIGAYARAAHPDFHLLSSLKQGTLQTGMFYAMHRTDLVLLMASHPCFYAVTSHLRGYVNSHRPENEFDGKARIFAPSLLPQYKKLR